MEKKTNILTQFKQWILSIVRHFYDIDKCWHRWSYRDKDGNKTLIYKKCKKCGEEQRMIDYDAFSTTWKIL